MSLEDIGLHVPAVLLPKRGVDLQKWAVIACDQHTNEKDTYWEQVDKFVGNEPSAHRLVLPEIYSPEQQQALILKIHNNMEEYIKTYLEEQEEGFVLVMRTLPDGSVRKGLVAALDLEKYDPNQGSQSLIRATERTLPSKLETRIRIRENAALEIPHIIMLIDDPEKTVIEPLFNRLEKKLYDFELMMSAGRLAGYSIINPASIRRTAESLERLVESSELHGVEGKKPILFAHGDGNHAIAAAKAVRESKKASLPADHPLRYALVEIENIHDPGVKFKPIHRLVYDEPDKVLQNMYDHFKQQNLSWTWFHTPQEAEQYFRSSKKQAIRFQTPDKNGVIELRKPSHSLAVGTLQEFLEKCQCKVDYVHGEEKMNALCSEQGTVGIYLPPLDRNELFRSVMLHGELPPKAFSIGSADDKRFYMEARKIR